MANKLIANQLHVEILVPVLKSCQKSHHDLKVCFKICKHQVTIKTEDEALIVGSLMDRNLVVLRVRERKREGIERNKERPKLCCSKGVLINMA